MQKNQIKIDLLGRSFTIRCDESPEHLQEIVTTLQKRIEHFSHAVTTKDPLKTAILVSFDLVDEVIKLRDALKRRAEKGSSERARSESAQSESAQIAEIAGNLIRRIDDCLVDT